MLLDALCDPGLNKEQAVALGRAAVRIDPAADATLARGLADSETGQGAVLVRDAPRLMEILCEVGDPSRMTPSMLRLLRHPDSRLRSRAVKVVGRGSKSAKWVRQRLNESDPSIRANAIEALWSVATDEARILLKDAAADGHNRVAANALMGPLLSGGVRCPDRIREDGAMRIGFIPVLGGLGNGRDPRLPILRNAATPAQ